MSSIKKTGHSIPEDALDTIASVLDKVSIRYSENASQREYVNSCARLICDYYKQDFNKPMNVTAQSTGLHYIGEVAKRNHLRVRSIALDEGWQNQSSGPLLVFYEGYDSSAALIPSGNASYVLIVPGKNIHRMLTSEDLPKIQPVGFMFYRTFGDEQQTWLSVLKFAFQNKQSELRRIFIFQLVISILSLFIPVATGVMMDTVIPNADYGMLWQFSFALIFNILLMAFFNLSISISVMRIRLKIIADVAPSVWDRLLRLPLRFFRKFTAGDLANRASGIAAIQNELSSSLFITFISGVTSFLSLGLMFYYDKNLTFLTLALIAVCLVVVIVFMMYQIRYLRKSYLLQGKVTGLVLQLLINISKLKLTNSIGRAFNRWADVFSKKAQVDYVAGNLGIKLTVFSSLFGVVTTMSLFAAVMIQGEQLSFGTFIAFNAIYAQFFASIFALIGVVSTLMRLVPVYERVKPILDAEPELTDKGIDPGELTGKVDFLHVAFRYNEDSPVVLKDISFSVQPGEFIALVGPSGCGKSSIFRLLLGFEQVTEGKVYYSDRELATLNVDRIRSQLGVVLQDTLLFPGSILENLIGGDVLPDKQQIHEVLKQVQLYDEIIAMPMGLYTSMSEFGRTLSVGQRQRLLLARALIKKPKILLLDEATSALDNKTQKLIHDHLKSMNITRIVAAHRMSSIQHADRIYVIDNGLIQQSGTFEELLGQKGLFQELAQHQSG